MVTERCSTGNPVVRLANGIRTLCVRETDPRDDWEALHSRLDLTFSLNFPRFDTFAPTKSLLIHRESSMDFEHYL